MSVLREISDLQDGETVSICGVVDEVDLRNTGVGRSMLGVLIRQENQFLRALWFNQPFMKDKFKVGSRVLLSGEVKQKSFRWEMVHPRVQAIAGETAPQKGDILPVYPLTEGINQNQMRRLIRQTVESYAECLDEVVPESYRTEQDILSIEQAVHKIHVPDSLDDVAAARLRFKHQELLVLQLALAMRRRMLRNDRRAPKLPATAKIHARILNRFPFELTEDQTKVLADVGQDMAADVPMNRLVQGDVGSGKTVIAQYAMLLAVAHGHQAALMAPTEVLARQHARTLQQNLGGSQVRIGLLTGGTNSRRTPSRSTRIRIWRHADCRRHSGLDSGRYSL